MNEIIDFVFQYNRIIATAGFALLCIITIIDIFPSEWPR